MTFVETLSLFLAGLIVYALFSFWVGYRTAVTHHHFQKDLNEFVAKNYPDVWSAYKRGVTEGYEQGLRDGQDLPDESA